MYLRNGGPPYALRTLDLYQEQQSSINCASMQRRRIQAPLKGVLFKSHPAFYDQPSTLITSYQMQPDLSILEYYKLFLDYEQLRAYIANISTVLDETTELDIFIQNAKYNTR
jgi:hypothetical protein